MIKISTIIVLLLQGLYSQNVNLGMCINNNNPVDSLTISCCKFDNGISLLQNFNSPVMCKLNSDLFKNCCYDYKIIIGDNNYITLDSYWSKEITKCTKNR